MCSQFRPENFNKRNSISHTYEWVTFAVSMGGLFSTSSCCNGHAALFRMVLGASLYFFVENHAVRTEFRHQLQYIAHTFPGSVIVSLIWFMRTYRIHLVQLDQFICKNIIESRLVPEYTNSSLLLGSFRVNNEFHFFLWSQAKWMLIMCEPSTNETVDIPVLHMRLTALAWHFFPVKRRTTKARQGFERRRTLDTLCNFFCARCCLWAIQRRQCTLFSLFQ